MHVLNRLGLRTKIALPFALTAVALIIVGISSVVTTRNLAAHTNQVTTTYLPSVSEILNGDRDLYQALVAQKSLLDQAFNNEDTSAAQKAFNENTEQARRRFEESTERLKGTGISAETEGFSQAFDQWEQSARRVMALANSGNPDQARQLANGEAAELFDQLRDYYDTAGAHADEQAQQRSTAASSEAQTTSATVLTLTLLAGRADCQGCRGDPEVVGGFRQYYLGS